MYTLHLKCRKTSKASICRIYSSYIKQSIESETYDMMLMTWTSKEYGRKWWTYVHSAVLPILLVVQMLAIAYIAQQNILKHLEDIIVQLCSPAWGGFMGFFALFKSSSPWRVLDRIICIITIHYIYSVSCSYGPGRLIIRSPKRKHQTSKPTGPTGLRHVKTELQPQGLRCSALTWAKVFFCLQDSPLIEI